MPQINILLVEDEAPKRRHIQRFLDSLDIDIELRVAHSVNSALDSIEERSPDLLLLDMSLPTFDIGDRESGGRPQGFGGIEVLRQMALSEMGCPTIVITGYEAFLREAGKTMELSELRKQLENEFPSYVRGVLHYNSTYDEWKVILVGILEGIGISRKGVT